MTTARDVTRDEISQSQTINRREAVENIYYLGNCALSLRAEHYDRQGRFRGEAELHTPILCERSDRGRWFCGLPGGQTLIGLGNTTHIAVVRLPVIKLSGTHTRTTQTLTPIY